MCKAALSHPVAALKDVEEDARPCYGFLLEPHHLQRRTRMIPIGSLKQLHTRYAFALTVSLVCLALTLGLHQLTDKSMFQLSVVAVVLSAWYGGLGPGLVSALLSSLGTAFFLLDPQYSFTVGSIADGLQLAVFMLVSVLMSVLSETRHRAELALRERTAELEVANNELEAFSYTVSHDLRSPLRLIDNHARVSLESVMLPPPVAQALQLIRRTAQQTDELVNGLLDFSRLGRQPLHKHPIDVANLVDAVLEDLGVDQTGRSVKVSLGSFPACEADPTLLKVVFTNLLHNALKFTRTREEARIEVGCLTAGEPIYYVKDNGIGFDMQYARQLFGMFQRLHQQDVFEGTGVGLAIVQRIVRRHGGRIWAEAQKDLGATFYFTLSGGDQT